MRVARLALLTALVAGCSLLPPPAGIQLEIPARAETRALPVTVVDRAGVVRDATAAPNPADFDGTTTVRADPDRPDSVVVAWMGGACDDRAIVTIGQDGARYRTTVESPSSAMSCSAVGVSRAILLSLVDGVDPASFAAP